MNKEIVYILEEVVSRAWKEEKAFSKSVIGIKIRRNGSVCQGISRNVYHKIFGVFTNSFMAKFKVKGKSHIVVHVAHLLNSYVIDGTIKQFLPKEKRTVFLRKDYPFKKELQKAERWLS